MLKHVSPPKPLRSRTLDRSAGAPTAARTPSSRRFTKTKKSKKKEKAKKKTKKKRQKKREKKKGCCLLFVAWLGGGGGWLSESMREKLKVVRKRRERVNQS